MRLLTRVLSVMFLCSSLFFLQLCLQLLALSDFFFGQASLKSCELLQVARNNLHGINESIRDNKKITRATPALFLHLHLDSAAAAAAAAAAASFLRQLSFAALPASSV
jgi:hypothetical protein